jgi:TRAP transporter TAXI family solute receptor
MNAAGKVVRLTLALAAFLAFFLAPPTPALATEERPIIIGSGGVAGVYYPVAGIVCRLLDKGRRAGQHNLHCQVAATEASVFNLNFLRTGVLSLGETQSDALYDAYRGEGAFAKQGPNKSLRVIFTLQAEALTVVARDDSGIASFDDLAGKRVNLGAPGAGGRGTVERFLKAYGWTNKSFELVEELPSGQSAVALCDGLIDAFVQVTGHPNGALQDAANACHTHLVPVEGPKVADFLAKLGFYREVVIPGSLYRGADRPVATFGPRAALATTADLPAATAYEIAKAVLSDFSEFKSFHPALADLTPESTVEGNAVPFHPGAERYFREIGLLK